MPDYKIDFEFNQLNRGFSETWYAENTVISSAMSAAVRVAMVRARALAADVSFEAIRISDVLINGDSGLNTDCTTYTKSVAKGDVTSVGILVRCVSGTLYRKPFIIRGLPDIWLDRTSVSGKILLTDPGTNAVKRYLDAVKLEAWRFRCRPKVAGLTDYSNVTAVGNDITTPVMTIVTCAGIAASVHQGTVVQIRGARKSGGALNGVWIAQAEHVGDTFKIPLNYVGRLSFLNPADITKAKARLLNYVYQIFDDYTIQDGRTRKSGRPFFVPAGKSRRRP